MSNAAITETSSGGWVPALTWGARLSLVRQQMGWNVLEAADACGLGRQNWANWEDGKGCRRQEEAAAKIASATGVSYVWLLTGQASPGVEVRSRCFSQDPEMTVIAGEKHKSSPTTSPDRSHLRLVR